MPRNSVGQQITFTIELDSAHTYSNFQTYTVKPGETLRSILAKLGHPEMVTDVAEINGIRDINAVLLHTFDVVSGHPRIHPSSSSNGWAKPPTLTIKVPGTLNKGDVLNVLAGDPPPVIVDGYAKFTNVDRVGRKGINQFTGYNPIGYKVPIQFEGWTGGPGVSVAIEQAIQLLERMAGRGHFSGAATGAPAVIQVSVTDNNGQQVMLVPFNYQWSNGNPTAPLWRVSDIQWDENPLRDSSGRRLRQKAIVMLGEYTPIHVVERSAAARAKSQWKRPGTTNKPDLPASRATVDTLTPADLFPGQA